MRARGAPRKSRPEPTASMSTRWMRNGARIPPAAPSAGPTTLDPAARDRVADDLPDREGGHEDADDPRPGIRGIADLRDDRRDHAVARRVEPGEREQDGVDQSGGRPGSSRGSLSRPP